MAAKTSNQKTTRYGLWVAGIVLILAVFASGYYAALLLSPEHRQAEHKKPHQSISVRKDHSANETARLPQKTANRLMMSQAAKKLAEVETEEVKRDRAYVRLRMNGMVFHDETRLASLTSRVDGRIDKVFVDFTGLTVHKGDPVVTLWSRTLITTQIELFETIRSPEFDESVVKGAEEKLKQFGLTDDQIKKIRREKKPDLYITLTAPINGIVMKKNVNLGDFVKEGTVMYEIADLSKVWVKLDAYETDLPWIRYGQDVTFTTPALPGRTFRGQVTFIDPVLDMATRAVKVRVEADNPNLSLKPHMFVTAEIEAEVDDKGRVIRSEWTGKYICPIDPRQVYAKPGICPTTAMPLRTAESYGYAPDKNPTLPLVIPATSVLYTGERSLVYVEVPDRPMPTYEPREVVLGPRAGDKYVVFSGLRGGEKVVTKGNFKIDSASQILAKASMMNPEEAPPPRLSVGQVEQAFREEALAASPMFGKTLTRVFASYSKLKEALASEHASRAKERAAKLTKVLKDVDPAPLDGGARRFWNRLSKTMIGSLEGLSHSPDLQTQRKAFRGLSESLATVAVGFRNVLETPVYLYRCPTVFDNQGAYWIEGKKGFVNPYLGTKMPKCGELVAKIPPDESHLSRQNSIGHGSSHANSTGAHRRNESGSTKAANASHGKAEVGSQSMKEDKAHGSGSKP